jgi:hypothetical protein
MEQAMNNHDTPWARILAENPQFRYDTGQAENSAVFMVLALASTSPEFSDGWTPDQNPYRFCSDMLLAHFGKHNPIVANLLVEFSAKAGAPVEQPIMAVAQTVDGLREVLAPVLEPVEPEAPEPVVESESEPVPKAAETPDMRVHQRAISVNEKPKPVDVRSLY